MPSDEQYGNGWGEGGGGLERTTEREGEKLRERIRAREM
jgi:hypothetical protein